MSALEALIGSAIARTQSLITDGDRLGSHSGIQQNAIDTRLHIVLPLLPSRSQPPGKPIKLDMGNKIRRGKKCKQTCAGKVAGVVADCQRHPLLPIPVFPYHAQLQVAGDHCLRKCIEFSGVSSDTIIAKKLEEATIAGACRLTSRYSH